MYTNQAHKAVFLGALVMFISGCALFNPHRGPSLLTVEQQFQKETNAAMGVSNAIMYATSMWDAYNSAVQQHSSANISGSLLTTALAAGAVGAGAGGAGSSLILGLGSGAAGTYAGTTILVSRPRQYVYLAGMDAIECAIAVTRPFDLRSSDLATLESARNIDLAPLRDQTVDGTALWHKLRRAIQEYDLRYQSLTNELNQLVIKDIERDSVAYSYVEVRHQLHGDLAWLKEVAESITTENEEWKSIRADVDALTSKGLGLELKLDDLASSIKAAEAAGFDSKLEFDRVSTILTNASQVLLSAPEMTSNSEALVRKCQAAAGDLIQKITEIRAEVSRQVLRTEPDLTAIATQMGIALPRLTPTGASVPPPSAQLPTKQPEGAVPQVVESTAPVETRGPVEVGVIRSGIRNRQIRFDQIEAWILKLKEDDGALLESVIVLKTTVISSHSIATEIAAKTERIRNTIMPIRALIEGVNARIGAVSLSECVVKNQSGGVSVFPSSPITALIGSEFQLWVQGGKPPYEVSWPLKSDSEHVEATPRIVNNDDATQRFVVNIAVLTNAVTRPYVLLIKDMTGFQKAIVLDIHAATPK